MKILHTADWHIGSFKGPEKDGVNLRSEDTMKCLRSLVETAEKEKTEKIELVNNKFIEIVSDLDMIQIIKTTKQVDFENNNELISNTETTTKNIYYSKTLAELGVDKTQITTGVENKISFTITLHTDRVIYDLYKNPYFAIELQIPNKKICKL